MVAVVLERVSVVDLCPRSHGWAGGAARTGAAGWLNFVMTSFDCSRFTRSEISIPNLGAGSPPDLTNFLKLVDFLKTSWNLFSSGNHLEFPK